MGARAGGRRELAVAVGMRRRGRQEEELWAAADAGSSRRPAPGAHGGGWPELAVGGRRERRLMGPRVRRGEWIRRRRKKEKGEKKKIRGEKEKKKKLTEKYKKGQFRHFTVSIHRVKPFCQTFFKTALTPLEKPLHQRSQSRSRFWRSRSPAKQALSRHHTGVELRDAY